MAGRKQAVSNNRIKHLFVPMYETLTKELILDYAKQHDDFWRYLPDEQDIKSLPRQVSHSNAYSHRNMF